MRMLLRVSIPTETGNAAVKPGPWAVRSMPFWPRSNRKQFIFMPMMTAREPVPSYSI